MKNYTKRNVTGSSLMADDHFKAFGRFYRITDVTFQTGTHEGLVTVKALEVMDNGKLHEGNTIDIEIGKYGLVTIYNQK